MKLFNRGTATTNQVTRNCEVTVQAAHPGADAVRIDMPEGYLALGRALDVARYRSASVVGEHPGPRGAKAARRKARL